MLSIPPFGGGDAMGAQARVLVIMLGADETAAHPTTSDRGLSTYHAEADLVHDSN